jgi:hypothetical protein
LRAALSSGMAFTSAPPRISRRMMDKNPRWHASCKVEHTIGAINQLGPILFPSHDPCTHQTKLPISCCSPAVASM